MSLCTRARDRRTQRDFRNVPQACFVLAQTLEAIRRRCTMVELTLRPRAKPDSLFTPAARRGSPAGTGRRGLSHLVGGNPVPSSQTGGGHGRWFEVLVVCRVRAYEQRSPYCVARVHFQCFFYVNLSRSQEHTGFLELQNLSGSSMLREVHRHVT